MRIMAENRDTPNAQQDPAAMTSDTRSEFAAPADMPYRRFLRDVHQQNLFDWYMEIGCNSGNTLAPVRGKTIAIDPFFRVERNVIREKPALHVFQQTSDDFFAGGFLDALGIKLSFCFIDGMHLFEYALRDFMNAERRMAPGGVIALHDCCPFTHRMTTRDLDNLPPDAWTGDVWKIIPILQHYRPDLKIDVLGCAPTGLVLVSGLDPENDRLWRDYDLIIKDWTAQTLADYGVGRFYGSFDYVPADDILNGKNDVFADARLPEGAHKTPEYVTP